MSQPHLPLFHHNGPSGERTCNYPRTQKKPFHNLRGLLPEILEEGSNLETETDLDLKIIGLNTPGLDVMVVKILLTDGAFGFIFAILHKSKSEWKIQSIFERCRPRCRRRRRHRRQRTSSLLSLSSSSLLWLNFGSVTVQFSSTSSEHFPPVPFTKWKRNAANGYLKFWITLKGCSTDSGHYS